MKAFKFTDKYDDTYVFTVSFVKEISFNNEPLFYEEGEPRRANIPKEFAHFKTIDELIAAGTKLSPIGCAPLYKINKWLVARPGKTISSYVGASVFITKNIDKALSVIYEQMGYKKAKKLQKEWENCK